MGFLEQGQRPFSGFTFWFHVLDTLLTVFDHAVDLLVGEFEGWNPLFEWQSPGGSQLIDQMLISVDGLTVLWVRHAYPKRVKEAEDPLNDKLLHDIQFHQRMPRISDILNLMIPEHLANRSCGGSR